MPLGYRPLLDVEAIHVPDELHPQATNRALPGGLRTVPWPVAFSYQVLDLYPAVFVELASYARGGLLQPLTQREWRRCQRQMKLSRLQARRELEADSGYIIEFGPATVVRRSTDRSVLLLHPPEPAWQDAVRLAGHCLVVIGTGLALANEDTVVVPETAGGVIARYGGTFVTPSLTEIPGLHVLPLTMRQCQPLLPCGYVLDTNVLIGIERFCVEPHRLSRQLEPMRHILLHLAYRDVFAGAALTQLHESARGSRNDVLAMRALAALNETAEWDMPRIAAHSGPCHPAAVPKQRLVGPGVHPAMLALYAGILRLRSLWDPEALLPCRASAFEAFVVWIRDELRVAAVALVQIAANLLISDEEAHRQAARLLHFSASWPTPASLAEFWGSSFDLFLLTIFPQHYLMDDVLEPVLLTFDAGLAEMQHYFRHVGMTSVLPDAGPDDPVSFLVTLRLDLNPRLQHLRPHLEGLLREVQGGLFTRATKGEWLFARTDEMSELAVKEEQRLLRGNRSFEERAGQ